jgi:cytidine deaminase
LKATKLSPNSLYQRAKVPYTNQAAFSIVETTDSHFYAGVRVENSVYPLTIESAQSAIATTLSQGKKPAAIHTWENPAYEMENSADVYASQFQLMHVVHSIDEALPSLNTPKIFDSIDDFSKNDWPIVDNSALISNFLVGSLLKTNLGWLLGTNFEHAFLGLGLCAERTAIATAISYGLEIHDIIHIFTKNKVLATPCGACRQVGSEQLPNSTTAYLQSDNDKTTSVKWADLLPFPFELK